MKKIYLLLLACTVLTFANAQKFKAKKNLLKRPSASSPITNGLSGGCDTLNTAILNDSLAYILPLIPGDTTYQYGFYTGTNAYGNLGNAQYIDASSTNDSYVTRADVFFGAFSTYDTTKIVPIDIFDGTGDTVGALIGTTNVTLGQIYNSLNDTFATALTVIFNPAVKLPASKQFFVAVDYSYLNFNSPYPDYLSVLSTNYNQGSGAWQDDNPILTNENGWHSFVNDFGPGYDVSLWMLPYLSTGPLCGASLPVHLISFTAQTKESDVLLNWQVTQEVNMKEYDVERAGSNLQFAYVGTVQAVNSPLNHYYSFTDVNALAASAGSLFYRLKQVSADGVVQYSNIVKVNTAGAGLAVRVVNPFSGAVQVHISSPVAQKLQAAIYDVQGRKVAPVNAQMLSQGDNVITVPAGNLPHGVYILTLTAGSNVYNYKILRQ